MARRFALVLVPAFVFLALALGLPLGLAVAERGTQAEYLERLADAAVLADLAERTLETSPTDGGPAEVTDAVVPPELAAGLQDYADREGAVARLVSTEGEELFAAASPSLFGTTTDRVRQRTEARLGGVVEGRRPEPVPVSWPWDGEPLVVVQPVVDGAAGVVAAVVLLTPTLDLHDDVIRQWALLAAAGALPLAVGAWMTRPLARWLAAPIADLDRAAVDVAGGDLSARADETSGPPEVRRLAVSFNGMVAAVHRSDERQRRFVADASHQLRNPLASLRLGVENVAPHVVDDDGRVALTEAVEAADAMGRMLEALLAAARTEAVPPRPVRLDEVLDASRAWWAERAREAGVTLRVGLPPLVVVEPAGGLQAVLDELVDNALRLSGGSVVEVRAEEPRDGCVVVHVVDDGCGLDALQRERALERFWRAPEHQGVPGTGLGLAVCAELLAVAGGRLDLAEADAGGVDAAVTLRLAGEDPEVRSTSDLRPAP